MAGGAGSLFGPMLIGVFLNCILYGVVVIQTCVYYQTYRRDARWIKILVFYLLFCETLNTTCNTGVVFDPLILHYGSPRAFSIRPIMLVADVASTVMISTPVQFFIAWRIKVMNNSTILPVIIAIFAVASFVGGVTTSVSIANSNDYPFFPKFSGAMATWLASSAAANVIITAFLAHKMLYRCRGLAGIDDPIDKVIRVTVHTGLITTVSTLISVVLPAIMTHTTVNYIWGFTLSKLYSNSFLSILNARRRWKSSWDNALFVHESGGGSVARNRTQIQVEIVTVRDHHVDHHPDRTVAVASDSKAYDHQEHSASAISLAHKVVDKV